MSEAASKASTEQIGALMRRATYGSLAVALILVAVKLAGLVRHRLGQSAVEPD